MCLPREDDMPPAGLRFCRFTGQVQQVAGQVYQSEFPQSAPPVREPGCIVGVTVQQRMFRFFDRGARSPGAFAKRGARRNWLQYIGLAGLVCPESNDLVG